MLTQEKAGREQLGAADSAGRAPYDEKHPGVGGGHPGVGQDDAQRRHPGAAVGPDDGEWHPGGDASRPGDASLRQPGGGVAPGRGQDDAAHQHYGPGGVAADEGQWHAPGSHDHPGDPAHRHAPDRHPGEADPHSRLGGGAPLATGEDDLTGSSRPTDIDEAIARATAAGPLESGVAGPGFPGAAGAGADRPYTRVRQSENVKQTMKVPLVALTSVVSSLSVDQPECSV